MPKLTTCPNCATDLRVADNFCPHCGQENRDLRVPVRQFLLDSLNTLLHITSFEGKLWQTLGAIFTRPGKLTEDYLAGRRARYVAPMRFYLWVSLLFFLLLGALADEQLKKQNGGVAKAVINNANRTEDLSDLIRPDTLLAARGLEAMEDVTILYPLTEKRATEVNTRLRTATDNQLDSLLKREKIAITPVNRRQLRDALALLPAKVSMKVSIRFIPEKSGEEALITFANDSLRRVFMARVQQLSNTQLDSIIRQSGGSTDFLNGYWNRRIIQKWGMGFDGVIEALAGNRESQKDLLHVLLKNTSTVMFLLMPFVAFLLWLFYVRRKRYRRFYYEHLIFSIHIHTAIFLFLSLVLAVFYFANLPETQSETVMNGVGWVSWLYILVAIKRVYRQSWLRTTAKFMLLTFIYSISAVLFVAVAAVVGLITI